MDAPPPRRARRQDAGQADLFGRPEPASAAPPRPKPRRRAEPAEVDAAPPPEVVEVAVEVLAERLTAADLDALAAAMPDESLAHLVLSGMRQLRRRLVRTGAAGGRAPRAAKGRGASVLERAARQVAAELGGAGGGEEG